MATVAINDDWKDVATDQSLTVGTEYSAQALDGDLEYIVNTSSSAPADNARGFILFYGRPPASLTPKQNQHIWFRRHRRIKGSGDNHIAHLQIEA